MTHHACDRERGPEGSRSSIFMTLSEMMGHSIMLFMVDESKAAPCASATGLSGILSSGADTMIIWLDVRMSLTSVEHDQRS